MVNETLNKTKYIKIKSNITHKYLFLSVFISKPREYGNVKRDFDSCSPALARTKHREHRPCPSAKNIIFALKMS